MGDRLSAVFLTHALLEAPLIIQGFLYPQSLPFLSMDDTTLVLVKLLSAMSLGTCLISLWCYWRLPDFLPGKRVVAMGLSLYHVTVSAVLFQAPHFTTFSPQPFEGSELTPEGVWGILHGIVGLWFGLWWGWVYPPPLPVIYLWLPPPPVIDTRLHLTPAQTTPNGRVGPRRRRGRN